LREIGAWLSVNGEAIYGARPWVIPAEGPTETEAGSMIDSTTPAYTSSDIRFTTRTDVTGRYVYAIILAAPESGVVKIRAFGAGSGLLGRPIQEVSVLGGSGAATVQRTVVLVDAGVERLVLERGGRALVEVDPSAALFDDGVARLGQRHDRDAEVRGFRALGLDSESRPLGLVVASHDLLDDGGRGFGQGEHRSSFDHERPTIPDVTGARHPLRSTSGCRTLGDPRRRGVAASPSSADGRRAASAPIGAAVTTPSPADYPEA
jgi:hypothetical protein